LALRLVKHLAAADADAAAKNVAFSPVSIHAGLALVAAGAGGATRAQLLSFLGAPTADGLAAFGRLVADRVLADKAGSGGPRVLFGGGFHRLDGSHVEAAFMYELKTMSISCMDGFKVLKLPYGPEGEYEPAPEGLPYKIYRGPRASSVKTPLGDDATQFSMFVFLPDERDGMATMVDVITAAPGYLYSVLPTETKLVQINLPKFEVSLDWDLGSDLRRLGLTLPFSRKVGDLRGMYKKDDGRPTFLTKVAHKAIIKVNEEGTEAAAVMTALSGGGPMPDHVEFIADHPFTFIIMEERSGVIVFAGHVLDPTCK
uniref:Serpin domain-containing protein n=1 Tax=Aegilops tauschii subsp. strangulata TaxID=200361 RepID=A0A452Y0P6_AEGTS